VDRNDRVITISTDSEQVIIGWVLIPKKEAIFGVLARNQRRKLYFRDKIPRRP
jgi:hypothetical protein